MFDKLPWERHPDGPDMESIAPIIAVQSQYLPLLAAYQGTLGPLQKAKTEIFKLIPDGPGTFETRRAHAFIHGRVSSKEKPKVIFLHEQLNAAQAANDQAEAELAPIREEAQRLVDHFSGRIPTPITSDPEFERMVQQRAEAISGAGRGNVNVEGHRVSVGFLGNTHRDVREFLQTSEGEKMIVDIARRRRVDIGVRT